MDPELIKLITAVGVLTERVQNLEKIVDRQTETVAELLALANQGKGSVWLLMSIGGLIGFMTANAKGIIAFFTR